MADQKLPFETYFDNRIVASGSPPPEGDFYLIYRSGVVYKTSFGSTAGQAYFTDSSDVTTITGVDTWTPPANTLVQVAITPTLTFAANAFTYVGADQISPTRVFASISGRMPDPVSVAVSVGIAINGTPVTPDQTTTFDDTTLSHVASSFYPVLSSGDVITMVIKNRNTTDDIILQDGQLSIGA